MYPLLRQSAILILLFTILQSYCSGNLTVTFVGSNSSIPFPFFFFLVYSYSFLSSSTFIVLNSSKTAFISFAKGLSYFFISSISPFTFRMGNP